MGKTFKAKGTTLTLKFDNEEALNHFKSWLDWQGEQDYWTWMECREQEESGPITGVKFDYFNGDTIKIECGRLDDER